MYIGLHSGSELWLKENLVNVAAQHLTLKHFDWQNLAELDSDVHFLRPNWVGECIQQLQHYSVLQMFTQARDLGPNYEMLDESQPFAAGMGWAKAWKEGLLDPLKKDLAQLEKDVEKLDEELAPYSYPPR